MSAGQKHGSQKTKSGDDRKNNFWPDGLSLSALRLHCYIPGLARYVTIFQKCNVRDSPKWSKWDCGCTGPSDVSDEL